MNYADGSNLPQGGAQISCVQFITHTSLTTNVTQTLAAYWGEMHSRLAIAWFFVSTLVVLWDASFVLLRPRSLPGGDLHVFFKPYALYITIDTNYGDMEHTFTIGQSLMNLAEVCIQVYSLALLLRGRRSALFWTFFVSSLTLWKTILYVVQYTSLCNGGHILAHVDWVSLVALFIIPNCLWIVVPLFFVCSCGVELLNMVASFKEKRR